MKNSPKHRLFLAIRINDELKTAFAEYRKENEGLEGLNWVPDANMHITLVFLGDIREEKFKELKSAVGSIAGSTKQLTLVSKEIHGSDHKKPMIWLEFDKNDAYDNFTYAMRRALNLFAKLDDRAPRAHVTLARSKNAAEKKGMIPVKEASGIELNITHVELWESTMQPDGVIYSGLGKFALSSE